MYFNTILMCYIYSLTIILVGACNSYSLVIMMAVANGGWGGGEVVRGEG